MPAAPTEDVHTAHHTPRAYPSGATELPAQPPGDPQLVCKDWRKGNTRSAYRHHLPTAPMGDVGPEIWLHQ